MLSFCLNHPQDIDRILDEFREQYPPKYSSILCFIFTGITCGLILLFAKYLLYIFNKDPDVISIGTVRLQIIFFAYVFSFAQEN
ncbi:MAG: hypothetical protein II175_01125, partial [Schwartzia sp.]|nr:hypothetical protein [Schwartzia sp. (in: firmicutes)]